MTPCSCLPSAFTELQTDLELAYDKSDQHLPFLEFRSFAMRVLFPQEKDHPVLQPLAVSAHLAHIVVVCGCECAYIQHMQWLSVVVSVHQLHTVAACGGECVSMGRCLWLSVCIQPYIDTTIYDPTHIPGVCGDECTSTTHSSCLW